MIKAVKNFLRKHERLEFPIKVLYYRLCALFEPLLSDEAYIRGQYRRKTGRKLNLIKPRLYNEKIQWLKLNYKNPLLNRCVDKWQVRSYVEEKGLGHLLITAYGPWNSVDEIRFSELPDQFILKLTNGSSFNLICADKSTFDKARAKKMFDAWVSLSFFAAKREWAYKDVRNQIMAERLITTASGNPPSDTRLFCFHGEPKLIAVDVDSIEDSVKTSNYYRHLYDIDWNPVAGQIEYPKKLGVVVPKPHNLDEMLTIARKLSADFPFVRVDLYNNMNRIYFGELTFYHASGYQNIQPEAFHEQLGSYLDLARV